MGTRWRGLLAPIDAPTGDHRRLLDVTNRALPLPHRWQRLDSDGHTNSVSVGLTDAMAQLPVAEAVEQGWISAEGAARLKPDLMGLWGRGEYFDDVDATVMPRLAQDVKEAMYLADKGILGPSVGPGSAEFFGTVHPGTQRRITDADIARAQSRGVPLEMEDLFTKYEVAETTMVPVPAFGETSAPFEILDAEADCLPGQHRMPDGSCMDDDEMALTAAVSGATDLPVADRDAAWDGDAAKGRVFNAYTDGDKVDAGAVGRAFLWTDPDGDPASKSSYKLGFADVVDGQLRIIPGGVVATAGGRGVDAADIPADAKATIKAKICTLYGKVRSKYDDWPDCPFSRDEAAAEKRAALVAAAAAEPLIYPADAFDVQPAADAGPIVTEDRGEGFRRVYGYAARWETCHTGVRGVCTRAPKTKVGYAWFHRYPINTSGGLVAAGRLTTGYGRVGPGCTHPGCRVKEDHACDRYTLAETINHYDKLKTLAWVKATETPHGLWLAGVTVDDLNADDLAVLNRRRVSGDWRPYADDHEMAEVLALAREEPGFPVHLHNGRQTALLAAGALVPDEVGAAPVVLPGPESPTLAADVADLVITRLRAEGAIPALVAAAEPQTGAMVALIPTGEHAARLAVPVGGLAPDDLHTTLMYLGEADTIPPEAREQIISMLRAWVDDEVQPDYDGMPIEADGFNVSMFNPPGSVQDDGQARDPCIVLGLSGADLEMAREMVAATLTGVDGLELPEQHAPYVPHVTLTWTDNPEMVASLTDRTGPVEFDRLRVAFGGDVTDLPIVRAVEADEPKTEEEDIPDAGMAVRAGHLAAQIEAGALLAEVMA